MGSYQKDAVLDDPGMEGAISIQLTDVMAKQINGVMQIFRHYQSTI